jgi:Xaa-Pro aminopeptidase
MSISEKEYSNRYSAIRKKMKADGFDCLLVAGLADDFNRGNIRYITGSGRGGYCIFPLEGTPVLFTTSPLGNSPKVQKTIEAYSLLEVRKTQDFVKEVLKTLRSFDQGNATGLVGSNCVSVPIYLKLKELLGDRLIDVSKYFLPLREIKSEEEIEKIRTAASIADKVYLRLREIIRPGLSEYSIYGEVKKVIYEEGCEYSFDLIDAAGSMMNMAFYPTEDRLDAHGTLFIEISPSFQGYYAQLPVTIPVDHYPDHILQMVEAWNHGDTSAHPMLRPGTKVSDLYHTLIDSIEEMGFKSPLRPGHSVGLDILDFWLIDADNPTILKPGMTIAVHPCSMIKLGGDGVGMGYTYLITKTGFERFSKIDLANELISSNSIHRNS